MLRLISGHVKNSTYPEHPLERKFLMQHMWRTRSSHKTQREVNAMNSRAKCVQTLLLLHSFMVAFWIELINPPPPPHKARNILYNNYSHIPPVQRYSMDS